MPRTGENIYKRKDGRWEGRFIKERINGKAHYGAVYARSYRDVKCKLETTKKKLETEKNTARKAGTVADIGNRWLTEARGTLKDSSINKYEDMLRCYILPEFGNTELSEITNKHLIDFANSLLINGGINNQGLSCSTVAEIISIMNSLRIYAMKRDCTVLFSPECVTLKREQKKIRVFSMDEEACLITYLCENMDMTMLGILLCLFTGIRIGELCALKWDEINLSEQTLQIRRTMQRIRVDGSQGRKTEVKLCEPKSICSIRTIPLPDMLIELLSQYYAPGTFLLTGDSSRYVEPRTIQYRFKNILKACNISEANFHTTRHTFATRCIELGFDVKSLSEILGHSSVAITMNRYVHPTMALKAENMNRFSDLFTVK